MRATGIITAVLDCMPEAIEDWNRWYDLEHTPPNLALEGVQGSHRYVATPELHKLRQGPSAALAGGKGSFVTIYVLAGAPETAFAGMVELRDQLVAADRMFPDEKKVVRQGDCLPLESVVADPALRAEPEDIAFLSHTGITLIERSGSADANAWYHEIYGPTVVELPGVVGMLTFSSLYRAGVVTDVLLLDGDPAEVTGRRQEQIAHHAEAGLVADATFEVIDLLRYPWADDLRANGLPVMA